MSSDGVDFQGKLYWCHKVITDKLLTPFHVLDYLYPFTAQVFGLVIKYACSEEQVYCYA